MISRFHYLTQDLVDISHQDLADIACRNGVRWLQLRVKGRPYDEWLEIAFDVKKICSKYGTKLVINDNVGIAKEIDADGVHVGKKDMQVSEARKILGKDKIIGGTANTLEDILIHQEQGADYVGFGPYKFTETKKNLSPIIGLDGYRQLMTAYATQIKIPIIAIGGIQLQDVAPLLDTGIHGIAVSSVVNLAEKKEEIIADLLSYF